MDWIHEIVQVVEGGQMVEIGKLEVIRSGYEDLVKGMQRGSRERILILNKEMMQQIRRMQTHMVDGGEAVIQWDLDDFFVLSK